jgi:hypothetical protein
MTLAIFLAGLGLVVGTALAVARPFFGMAPRTLPENENPVEDRWRRKKTEALAAIREAQFDFQLGKLSEEDYRLLRRRLELEALEAIRALDRKGEP